MTDTVAVTETDVIGTVARAGSLTGVVGNVVRVESVTYHVSISYCVDHNGT